MAISFANLPKFIRCTSAQYTTITTKDENALYFITDKNTFYMGSKLYSFDLVKSATDPTGTGVRGTIYYNTANGTAFVYDGANFLKLGVATLTNISGTVDDTTVPTSQAAKKYVDDQKADTLSVVSTGYVAKEDGKGLMANVDKTKLDTYPADYSTVENAIDGKVAKNTAIAAGNLVAAAADGAIADSGVAITDSVTDSQTQVPTSNAVKTYVDAAEKDAKDYADGLIDALGSVFEFKGTVANMTELAAVTDKEKGDVWHVTTGEYGSSAEYVYNGTDWEELGTTINLNGYVTKKVAASGKIAEFDSNGDVVGSDLLRGLDTTTAVDFGTVDKTIATEKAVRTYADAKSAEEANKKLAKLDGLTAENNNEILTVTSNGAAVLNSGKKFITEIDNNSTDTQVPTAAAVKAYADSVAQEAAGGKYLSYVTGGTLGNVPVLGKDGASLTDSGKAIGTTISVSDSDANAAVIPTAAAVKAYADTKISKVIDPISGNLVTVDVNGELVNAGLTASTATVSFDATPSATVLPNQQAVAATIQKLIDALAWQNI